MTHTELLLLLFHPPLRHRSSRTGHSHVTAAPPHSPQQTQTEGGREGGEGGREGREGGEGGREGGRESTVVTEVEEEHTNMYSMLVHYTIMHKNYAI